MSDSANTRLFTVKDHPRPPRVSTVCGPVRPVSTPRAHLLFMDSIENGSGLPPVLTTSQLAAFLGVPLQTIYDLRHAGRGPRGLRVGRQLRYRRTEVEQWLDRLEADDGAAREARP